MRANQIAYKAKLGNEAIQWSLMLAENDPTPINWLAAGQIIRDFGNFTNQESLDLGRLLMRQGAINADPRFSEREYVEYIQAADPRRLPAEVIKVAEAGIAKGALRANDTFVADALNQARGRIAADKASLAGLDRDAHAPSATAVTAMAAGDAFMSYDNAVKAEEFYKIALGKSGVDTPRILTRLGIAQSDQGKYAEALATFGKIDGTRKPLAQLWMLYVNQKSKPAS
jgi:tetratricopeptide (TPR) repeat protein